MIMTTYDFGSQFLHLTIIIRSTCPQAVALNASGSNVPSTFRILENPAALHNASSRPTDLANINQEARLSSQVLLKVSACLLPCK